jgi:hypothetical protein
VCFDNPENYDTTVVNSTIRREKRKYKPESYPIQDEPEGEGRFQHKMSLEGMAC